MVKEGKSRRGDKPAPGFVRPKTAQQAVVDALRRDITTGALPPGSQIVQDSLAEKFNMSRIPIREALKTLQAEEHVTYEPHSGYRVAKLDLDELIEVFRLRAILEETLIRDAMPNVEDWVVDEMRDRMVEMDAAATESDLVAVGVANRAFHSLTFERSSMNRTKRIVNQLWNTADAYRPLYVDLMDLAEVNCEHRLIADAMAARDVEEVITLNHRHRSHAIEHLKQILGPQDDGATS